MWLCSLKDTMRKDIRSLSAFLRDVVEVVWLDDHDDAAAFASLHHRRAAVVGIVVGHFADDLCGEEH